MDEKFFDVASPASKIKIDIVSKYFFSWSKVIAPRTPGNIAYIDLFSGKGIYDDGTKSIPVLIIESAIRENLIGKKLVTIFNDSSHSKELSKAINSISGINSLKNYPIIKNSIIDDDFAENFNKIKLIPTLLFVDPWGYKGISIKLIQSVLKDWGCDSIFFFNYNRINMMIDNPVLDKHLNIIFGEKRAKKIKSEVKNLSPIKREKLILNELYEGLKEIGGRYTIHFRFTDDKGKKTSHHLVFTTKNVLGYSMMKDIMAKASSSFEDGVPSYTYSPILQSEINSLFPKIIELEFSLLNRFKSKQITTKELYQTDSINKPFISKNYKEVLKKLESEGKIIANPSKEKRKPGTFADNVKITFI